MTKKNLIIADTHTGSVASLCHPTVTLQNGGKYKANGPQRYLYNRFTDMCDEIGVVDNLIILGDSCEGVNKRGYGAGLWTSEIDEQVLESSRLLNEIKARQRFMLEGSGYHVQALNMSADRAVAEKIKARYSMNLLINIDGLRCFFKHKIGGTSSVWMYKPTKVAREMLLGKSNEDEFGKLNIYGFAHVHTFVAVRYGNTYGFTCPCWKAIDGYVMINNPFGWYPQNGYINIETNNGEIEAIHEEVFTLKANKIITEVRG